MKDLYEKTPKKITKIDYKLDDKQFAELWLSAFNTRLISSTEEEKRYRGTLHKECEEYADKAIDSIEYKIKLRNK